ncbi:bifunctional DNA primase/polymerase [Streptomyces albiaxialis]|uniref:Bifunctional DNA primase/polymerase n=1 Tax=Streptomyces albiaxialis TaxID=329523 RepID=A0ABP5H569_9ACTN
MSIAALDHALAAASRGLPVLPLSRTKLPAVRSPHRARETASAPPGSPAPPAPPAAPAPPEEPVCQGECGLPGHGVHDATTDPDAIRALFAAAPWATGYGIACGRSPLHLVGLDLDVKNGTDSLAALERLGAEHGFTIPETTTVLTPSGGRHLWLRGPGDVTIPNSAGRLAPGIDVRGLGGYLVGPGSVTVRGTYRLAPGSRTRAPAAVPTRLLPLLLPPPPVPAPRPYPHPYAREDEDGRARGGTALVHFVRGARVGQRNARLFWAACRAYETGHGPELADALVEAAVATGLPAREARATLLSASHRAARLSPRSG